MTSASTTADLDFRAWWGPIPEQMPRLIAAGYVPASAAQIMRGRLEGKLSCSMFYDSGDAIAYHPNGRVKLVRNSKDLQELNPKSKLHDGALVLPDGAWESFDSEEFSGDAIRTYTRIRSQDTEKKWSKDIIKENPLWKWFAHDDVDLLCEYAGYCAHASYIFDRLGRYPPDYLMEVYVSNKKVTVPVLRHWSFGDSRNGDVGGDFSLDYRGIHLVGVKSSTRMFGQLATYRDAPCEAPTSSQDKKSRTLWDMIRGR